MRKTITTIAAVLALSGCGSNAGQTDTVINITVDDAAVIHLSDLADEVSYIPLETTDDFLMGEDVRRMAVAGDKVYFMCEGKSVLQFDARTGKGILNISKKGGGPDEYLSMADMRVDAATGTIEVLDARSKRIQRFDAKGNHLGLENLPLTCFAMSGSTDGVRWLDNGNYMTDDCASRLVSYNAATGQTTGFLPIDLRMSEYYYFDMTGSLCTAGGRQLYCPTPPDTIYALQGGRPQVAYTLSFGKHTAPKSFYDEGFEDGMDFMQKAERHGYIYWLQTAAGNQDLLHIGFRYKVESSGQQTASYWGIYRLNGKQTLAGRLLDDDVNHYGTMPLSQLFCYTDDYLYICTSHPVFHLDDLSRGLQDQLRAAGVNAESNPVLMRCHLRRHQ